MNTLEYAVAKTMQRMSRADEQLARYYKFNPNPKPYILNGKDITEWTIKRLKESGAWDRVSR